MEIKDYLEGIQKCDRAILGKSITLTESSLKKDKIKAEKLLSKCIHLKQKSLRIGVSGTPGVGKSTFIESLGRKLIKENYKIAVLAIDPSSNLSKGSILGDKTRMEHLVNSDLAFIRPSPNSGTLGGVSKNTKDAITICEAAGFDIIIIETVGVGQAETLVKSMTDILIYLTLIQNGDELQFIKKGILELCDIILINKCDQNHKKSKQVAVSLQNSLTYTQQKIKQSILVCSALNGFNITNIWEQIKTIEKQKNKQGIIKKNSSF
jgi:LAO/AO transport system kinase